MNKTQGFAALLALAPAWVHAAGYYLPNQDAFATAKGNAFVATADNPSAVFYNPAGMTQLDSPGFQMGAYSIVLGNEVKMNGERHEARDELQVAPSIFYAAPFNEKISYGFALNSPFGLGTEWGQDTPFRTVVTEARLMYVSGTSAIAYKVTDTLSVGAAFSVNYADLTLEQGIGGPGSYFRYEGNGLGVSGGLSVLWQPAEKHSFGATYTTKSTFNLEGSTTSDLLASDHSAELDFMAPARASIGYSFRPKPGWNFEVNVEWLDWDSLNTLTLESDSIGGSMGVPFEWKSSFIYEAGVSYTTPDGYVFAVGYDFNANSQPDENFTPGVSDANRHWFNLGFGRKGECNDWMVAYQFGYSNRTVDDAANVLANGRYESRHHALVLSWQHRF
ncbi:MAG: outer membrane protein transport protein [Akkermansiaceae bacterium]|nr:outer membrane protein transport protein [Akkermansiaceae bacterium]